MDVSLGRRSLRGIAGVAVLVAMLGASPATGQITKILPVDEAAREPDFFAFRARLLVAVGERDTSYLYGILADDVHNSFGGDGGLAEFKATWHPEQPGTR
jgi:hypothetical protein